MPSFQTKALVTSISSKTAKPVAGSFSSGELLDVTGFWKLRKNVLV